MSNFATNGSPSSFAKLLAVVVGVLYTVSPIDLLPDVILLLGWLDDIAVILAVVKYVRSADSATPRSPIVPEIQRTKTVDAQATTERRQ